MANPKKPLRFNVGFIVNSPIGYNRDFDFYFPIFIDEDLEIAEVEGVINVGRTPQGLIVQGNFGGKTALECVRCLSNYEQHLQWEFTELFAFKEENMTESGLMVPDDAYLDLQPLVREFAILELPIKPLCREDCRGLCTECGQNLNEDDCGHRPEIDSPFLALKDLLSKPHDDEEPK
ncbi:MAG: DUF177 domain-containing protein [Chloroflexi bacterium]|nr:DUF177 domain-containing protein [Chloroflexota bacterium]